ncbi:SDR family NAD(P)-dependent oxidoreductase [Pseudomonas sp. Fig-3]|jgi:NAD(P)-dependent dehydrogenase (short-subunit alcohol dehydrogenase family)|uniref:Short-chain dehydrogenase n=1 Tax=Pseudomonas rhizophila TaxID=2045200 RepID=A0ABN5JW04_9PSED|nr:MULTISPECIES: oxidoreductase [Pseudomonas]AVU77561.1 short-chain dehydrogenase [Pseudomonas rhizophila]MBD0701458.1 short-chain dehydrogenase [Pseudomonas sp. PSB1]MDD2030604.1 oxidoreductase [Pseudomonas sp. 39167]MEA1027479.1 oxidoreductase [Pseudomonas sp. N-137]MXR29895.1 SDR family NAD(P)-dependent oxidoreductase [Pseudomonas sp. PICF6]
MCIRTAATETGLSNNLSRLVKLARTLTVGAVLLSAVSIDASSRVAPKPDWSTRDMPSQEGRIVLITGGTSGMGYEDALALARAGADVIIAARNPERGAQAIAQIKTSVPDAKVQFEAVDLANLSSVRSLAQRLNQRLPRLDVLINNAAVMAPPERGTSADGFELQLATNYLGHFALTGLLVPLLRQSQDARVVSLSSIAAARGTMNFNDLQAEQQYQPLAAYAQSKLAILHWTFALQQRSEAAGWNIRSIAAHPGVAVTELVARGPGLNSEFGQRWAKDRDVYHSAAQGALPTLYAATAPEAVGGAYYGPTGDEEKRGPLGFARMPPAATHEADAERLWTVSERLTGVTYR